MSTNLKTAISFCFVVLSLLIQSYPAAAASNLTLLSTGEGGYSLQGAGVEGVAALDITIAYDTSTLANPTIVSGPMVTGSLSAVNTNVPGVVRMVIITTTPIIGSGTIANLTFSRTGAASGTILSLVINAANLQGTKLPVLSQIINASDAASANATQQDQPSTTTSTAASSQEPASTGTTTSGAASGPRLLIAGIAPSPGVPVTKNDPDGKTMEPTVEPDKKQELRTLGTDTMPPTVTTEKASADNTKKEPIYTEKSVLELFRDLRGERSMKAFLALFKRERMVGFRQEPAIVLSDGKGVANITFIALAPAGRVPDVKPRNATLVAINKDPDNTNTWTAIIRPDKGASSATLAVAQDRISMLFPITVAPRVNVDLDRSGNVNEADFNVFMKERGTTAKPKHDLNKDGRRDAIDDYIFTANYIVATSGKDRTR